MSDEARRIVLIKPGDILAVGNLGRDRDPEELRESGERIRDQLDLAGVLMFSEDIDLEAVASAQVVADDSGVHST